MTKAFDRIDRSTLLEDLKEILEPQELKMFQILLTDTEIRIKIKNMFGKIIKTNIGSPQGDSASAILFILYLALRLRKYKKEVDKDDLFIEVQYADDLGWITNKEKYTTNVKENIPNILKEGNLEINPSKTEELKIQHNSEDKWKKTKYLGTLLDMEADFRRRKKLATTAFKTIEKFITNKKSSTKNKIKRCDCFISSIFLYNSELWAPTKRMTEKINCLHRSFLRKIMNTSGTTK